jgi:DNA invertase Pin-like site-specific DNA recombinase
LKINGKLGKYGGKCIMNRIQRVGLYGRVSTDEQAIKGFSIEAQVDALKEYCEKKGLKIVDIYLDEGISGAKPPLKRPALKRLLDDVEAGKIDMILFTKLDRWFRSVKEYFKVQDILDNNKVEWKTIQEDYDTTTANGQMAITIFLAVAQNERDRTAERIKAVLDHKRKNKEACFGGHVAPFGYMKEVCEDGKTRLIKDPETQQACQDFWDILIDSNNRNKAIRHMLNEYGIQKDLKAWKRISQTEFYCGMYKGVQDYCPSYVTPEAFLKYQERDNVKNTPSGTIYYFRGMMRCPKCGYKLAGDRGRRPGRSDIKTYRCSRRSRTCTNHKHVSEKKTEAYLLENLDQLMRNTIAEVEVEAKDPKNKSDAERTLKTLKERLRRLNIMYMAGNKTDEEYFKEDAEIKLAISKAEKELEVTRPRKVDHLQKLLDTDWKGMYDKLTEERKQEFWQDLIKEIKIDGREPSEVIFYT